MGPRINQLFQNITNWVTAKDSLIKSRVFIEIVSLVLKFTRLMGSSKFQAEAGFDLRSLPRLFEVKSVSKRDKSAYEIIMKQYILRLDPVLNKRLLQDKDYASFWKKIPSQVFEEAFISQTKSLSPPIKLMNQLNEI